MAKIEDPPTDESAVVYARRILSSFRTKAEHNKRESLFCFTAVIATTLAVSGFVAFGPGEFCGKIVPLCLSLIATATSTWLQFRKPHQLWGIYRSAQRYIEDHLTRHRFEIEQYGRAKDKDRLLAKNVAEIALAAHAMWVPLIPSPEGLDRLADTSGRKPMLTPVEKEQVVDDT